MPLEKTLIVMRPLMIAALLLLIGGEYVFAEVAVSPRAAGTSELALKSAAKREHETAVANCVQMWDRGTHMTEQEWLRTCRRVQDRLRLIQK